MATLDQDRAAMRRVGLVPIAFSRQPGPCAGPGEPACIQALCVDCGSFSTAPSLTTPMQPAARFIRGEGWECVEFHAADCEAHDATGKPCGIGGGVATSSAGAGLAA